MKGKTRQHFQFDSVYLLVTLALVSELNTEQVANKIKKMKNIHYFFVLANFGEFIFSLMTLSIEKCI